MGRKDVAMTSFLKVHRQLSPLNGRSPLFLVVDGESQGPVRAFLQNGRTILPGEHALCVRDVLGFTSRTLDVHVQDGQSLELEAGGGNVVGVTAILLAVLTCVLETAFDFSHTMGVTIAVVIAWALFVAWLLGYWRHRLYFIRVRG